MSSELANLYSASAEDYKRLWAPELIELSLPLLDRLPLTDAAAVLDLGAGVGSLLSEISRRQPDAFVVGADLSEGMIRLAPQGLARSVMDARNLGFKDATFDVVVAAFMLFHVDAPGAIVLEALRVLRPGGTVATITWGNDPSYLALDIWADELDAHGAAPPKEQLARHDLVDDEDKVRGVLTRAGAASVTSWMGRYENEMTPESFLEHRTGHGMSRRRFESLPPEQRSSCLERVRARLTDVDPAGLVDRSEVVYAVAHKLWPPQE